MGWGLSLLLALVSKLILMPMPLVRKNLSTLIRQKGCTADRTTSEYRRMGRYLELLLHVSTCSRIFLYLMLSSSIDRATGLATMIATQIFPFLGMRHIYYLKMIKLLINKWH